MTLLVTVFNICSYTLLILFTADIVAADWNGDSINDFTIYRRSTGYWYIMLSKNPILQIFMQWGAPQFDDIPA